MARRILLVSALLLTVLAPAVEAAQVRPAPAPAIRAGGPWRLELRRADGGVWGTLRGESPEELQRRLTETTALERRTAALFGQPADPSFLTGGPPHRMESAPGSAATALRPDERSQLEEAAALVRNRGPRLESLRAAALALPEERLKGSPPAKAYVLALRDAAREQARLQKSLDYAESTGRVVVGLETQLARLQDALARVESAFAALPAELRSPATSAAPAPAPARAAARPAPPPARTAAAPPPRSAGTTPIPAARGGAVPLPPPIATPPPALPKDPVAHLHRAAAVGAVQAVRTALERGYPADARDPDGWTPLMAAAAQGRTEVVELLLARGANPNARAKSGLTPLMAACGAGSEAKPEIVRALLAKHADPRPKDLRGRTALAFAEKQGRSDLAALLRAAGARE